MSLTIDKLDEILLAERRRTTAVLRHEREGVIDRVDTLKSLIKSYQVYKDPEYVGNEIAKLEAARDQMAARIDNLREWHNEADSKIEQYRAELAVTKPLTKQELRKLQLEAELKTVLSLIK